MKELDNFSCQVTVAGRITKGDRSEPLFIGYSIKNRKFDRPFFEFAGRLAKAQYSTLLIAIFDHPYAYNEAAARNSAPTEADFVRCSAIGDERARMVRRALGSINDLSYEIRRWDRLDTSAAKRLRLELQHAVDVDLDLRAELTSHVKAWLPALEKNDPAKFLGFQISEIPVLIDLYYCQGYLTDLYPGLLNDFFFQLESGRWSSSMPIASAFASEKKLSALTYSPDSKHTTSGWLGTSKASSDDSRSAFA